MNLDKLILECSEVIEIEFGIKPITSGYKTYSEGDWKQFCNSRNLDLRALGVYLPRSLSAHLMSDSVFLPVNLFHEFFGHGLFCEYSLIGQQIVSLEQKIGLIETRAFSVEQSSEALHFHISKRNPYFEEWVQQVKQLLHFCSQSLHNYEGFAMWMEDHLAELTQNTKTFETKMEEVVTKEHKALFEQFKSIEERIGKYAFIYQLGFPKFYNREIIVDTLKRMYKDEFGTIMFAVLYGSRNPYSDIDIFIVSDKIKSASNAWLDVYAKSRNEFNTCLDMLDISVTDPLFSGEVIVGSNEQVKLFQEKAISSSITQEIITYNLQKSNEQQRIALAYPAGSKERRIGESYAQTCRINAEELIKGNKVLTLQNIKRIYRV